MPRMKSSRTASSRQRRKPPTSADQALELSSTVSKIHSKRLSSETKPTAGTSNISRHAQPQASRPNASVSKPISERAKPRTIPKSKILEDIEFETESVDEETVIKKTKVIASSSKHTVAGSLNVEFRTSREQNRASRSYRQHIEEDAPTAQVPTISRKSVLLASRRSMVPGNPSATENSRNSVRSKRQSFYVGRVQKEQDSGASGTSSESEKSIAELLGRSWHMYQVSPLYGFSSKPSMLRQYGRELRAHLTSDRAALPGASSFQYSASFTALPDLRWSKSRPGAVKVEVLSLKEGRQPVPLYTGVLLSWGNDTRPMTSYATPLPLLLCVGVVRTMRAVHTMLARLFDTVLQQIDASESDLEWVSAFCIRLDPPMAKELLHLHYANGTRKVTYVSLPAWRVQEVWSKIHDGSNSTVLAEEVARLHETLDKLIMSMNFIQLSRLTLIRIDFPDVTLTKDGRLKMRNLDAVDLTLRYFCSKATVLKSPTQGLCRNDTDFV